MQSNAKRDKAKTKNHAPRSQNRLLENMQASKVVTAKKGRVCALGSPVIHFFYFARGIDYMARKSESDTDSLRLDFMLNASRAAFNICPQLAAYFGNEFLTSCNEDNITPAIVRQSCPSCSVPLVAGRSVSRISVTRPTRSNANAASKRTQRNASKSRHQSKPSSALSCDGSKRIIEIGADGKSMLAKVQTNKAMRAATRAGQNSTIEYDCVLCSARIRFPSATEPIRDAAGQKRKAESKDACKQEIPCPQPDPRSPKPLTTTTIPSAPAASAEPKPSLNNSSRTNIGKQRKPDDTINTVAPPRASAPVSQSPITSTNGARSDRQPAAGTQPQMAKRKKHKSNLLAAVAANKKKAEAKKAAESGAFSLTDFLSNL